MAGMGPGQRGEMSPLPSREVVGALREELSLGEAAALAVQMDIPHQKALQIFKEHLATYRRKKGPTS